MEQPIKQEKIMYFEFHKLVYPILPRVIFKTEAIQNLDRSISETINTIHVYQHLFGKSSKFSR